MAWESTEWACGHSGSMQLYGKQEGRDATVAREAGRQCMACWLVGEWEKSNDPRAKREDRYKLAAQIAENKGKRIHVDSSVPVKNDADSLNAERAKLVARIAEIDAILNQ
uniref:Uncharacterized protein n=1 Tax=viral metagenome TaxID=1070528 RepID=A0A6H1ZET6_9ZZZZ